MQLSTVQRILGLFLTLFSLTLLPSLGIAWWTDDGALSAFTSAFLLTLGIGLVLWLPVRTH
ncbi:MAG: potassium transporter, partial [Gammaproteobacteria bacterium]